MSKDYSCSEVYFHFKLSDIFKIYLSTFNHYLKNMEKMIHH